VLPLDPKVSNRVSWHCRLKGPASIEGKCPAPFPPQGTQKTRHIKSSEPIDCKGFRAFILLQVSNTGVVMIHIFPLNKGPGHRLENGGELFYQVGLIPT